jgi:hypothetical protein
MFTADERGLDWGIGRVRWEDKGDLFGFFERGRRGNRV